MKSKTYKYFVSFTCEHEGILKYGNVTVAYGEPVDTEDMIDRVQRDVANCIDCEPKNVATLFFKRIKNDRTA